MNVVYMNLPLVADEEGSIQDVLCMLPPHSQPEKLDDLLQHPGMASHILAWSRVASESKTPVPSYRECLSIIAFSTFPLNEPGLKNTKLYTFGAGLFWPAAHRMMTPVCWDINVTMDIIGRELTVHATRDIQTLTAELRDLRYNELLNTFGHYQMTRTERRKVFQDIYGHPCNCRMCSESYEAEINPLKCGTIGCTERLPSDDRALSACPNCGAINDRRLTQYRKFLADYEISVPNITSREEGNDKKAVLFLEMEKAGILHSDAHIRFVCQPDRWQEWPGEDKEKPYILMQELIVCVRALCPKLNVWRAHHLLRICVDLLRERDRVGDLARSLPRPARAEFKARMNDAGPLALELAKEAREISTKLCGADSHLANFSLRLVKDAEEKVKHRMFSLETRSRKRT
ncbi:uncharacterized protein LOC129584429 [Paramacrobiotus metropolitanus]|uniref:uncharacterized protein LOC129584429 n=1 Tax=Paramacrobiotus metropolitanus TaxID=2943436 RepID=UPI002445F9CE|nr:uncharacterized protein LOC129584429 [Paramacrobiotus metropolitanus]